MCTPGALNFNSFCFQHFSFPKNSFFFFVPLHFVISILFFRLLLHFQSRFNLINLSSEREREREKATRQNKGTGVAHAKVEQVIIEQLNCPSLDTRMYLECSRRKEKYFFSSFWLFLSLLYVVYFVLETDWCLSFLFSSNSFHAHVAIVDCFDGTVTSSDRY